MSTLSPNSLLPFPSRYPCSTDNKLRAMMLLVVALDGLKPAELQQLFDTSNIPYTRRSVVVCLRE
jgi:hypothetical protein